jgi:ribosomal protein L23
MIEQLNEADRKEWFRAYNTAKVAVSPLRAKEVADKYVSNILHKRSLMVRTIDFQVVKQEGELLIRDEDGEYYFDAVLMGSDVHKDGKRISEELLMKWTDYINEHGLVADVDHETIKRLISQGKDMSYIKTYMKNKPGIAKAVKAFFEDGVLKVRTWIDKRYKNIISKVKGLSLESIVEYDKTDRDLVTGGDIFGFTFNVNTEPAYAGAAIINN